MEKAKFPMWVALASATLVLSACGGKGDQQQAEMAQKTEQVATQAAEQAKPAAETVQQKAETVRQQVEQKAAEVKAQAEEKAAEMKAQAEQKVEEVKAQAEQKVQEVKAEAEQKVAELAAGAMGAKAVPDQPKPPADKGAEVYGQCVGCHGPTGGGGVGPKLAGQDADSLIKKLKAYRAGEQVGPQTAMMAPIAQGLSDEDIEAVANYIANNFK